MPRRPRPRPHAAARPAGRGGARAAGRGPPEGRTRFEDDARHDRGFHERVRTGFRELAAAEPGRWRIVDASGDPPRVAAAVLDHVLADLDRSEPKPAPPAHASMNEPLGSAVSPPDATDEELLKRAGGGDAAALRLVYERYRSMAFALAYRITSDSGLAEDVLQEAFLRVWRNAARFVAARASARTWILSIVHHRAIDAVRRRRITTALPDGDALPPSLVLPDTWADLAGRLDRAAIQAAMGSISDVRREAIELAYFGGLTQQEIAERTGAPLGTVKSRVRLGLLGLRAALAGEALSVPAEADGPDDLDSSDPAAASRRPAGGRPRAGRPRGAKA